MIRRFYNTELFNVFIRSITIGNIFKGIKPVESSICTLSDIIGNESVGRTRMPAGDVLGMMDIGACRTAMHHLTGRWMLPESDKPVKSQKVSVATISFDETCFFTPLLHGDTVSVKGTPVHVGKSSIGIYIELCRIQFPTRVEKLVSNSFVTMVAINPDLSKYTEVPALELKKDSHIELNSRYKAILNRSSQKSKEPFSIVEITNNYLTSLQNAINLGKKYQTKFEDSVIRADRIFFSNNLNFNKTIFGGELMRWMEQHARHCARMFTGNHNVTTIKMHSVKFSSPVFLSDWVSLEAMVSYIHNSTMEVDVSIKIEHGDHTVTSNTASFILMSLDDAGQSRKIDSGLNLEEASEIQLEMYAKAKSRYELSRSLQYKKIY